MLTACHSQNGRAFQSVSICVCTLDVHSSWDVVLFGLSFSDPNANPNKRQRQPALLGDHPPEYGQSNTPSNGLTSDSCFIGAYGVYLIVFIFSRWSSGWLWSLWWHIWTTSPTPSLWGQTHGAPNGTWPWRDPLWWGAVWTRTSSARLQCSCWLSCGHGVWSWAHQDQCRPSFQHILSLRQCGEGEWVMGFCVFERHLLCSPNLHLFDQEYNNNCNVKYYYY